MCPECGSEEHRVTNSRAMGEYIRRRRECDVCGERFTTYETREIDFIHIEAQKIIRQSLGDLSSADAIRKEIERTVRSYLVELAEEGRIELHL